MVGSRVYIGGLPYGITERDLERFFRGYGRMRDVLIKNGYGFVEFDDYRDADDAVYELNGKKLLGERVTVERARGTPRGRDQWTGTSRSSSDYRPNERYGPPTRTNYRVVIENLSSRISWQDLKDYMRQAGEVTYADAHKTQRNAGVVEFANLSDMKTAIEKLNDTELNGRRLRITEDKNNRRGHSSSKSRSRSRSCSKSRRSHSRSYSKSRSKSRSASAGRNGKSHSRSTSRKKSVERSKSRSVSKSRSRSRDVKRSRSRSRDVKRSRSREASKERSRSRSRSTSKDRRKSRSQSVSSDH